MNALPKVSVVTPSYNQAAFLEETMLSVLNQDYPAIEYIVIDDGSTDGSVEIIRKYERRLAYWTTGPNRGQSHAINKGWKRASGDVIAYLNSDDTYLPGAVRTAVEFLVAHPDVGIVYGDCLATDEHGKPLETYAPTDFDLGRVLGQCRTPIPQPAAFIRAEVLEQVGLLDEDLFIAMDFDLWLRAGLEFPLAHIPVTMATYRLHPQSKTVSKSVTTAPDVLRIYRKLLENPALPAEFRNQRRLMSAAYRRAAEEYYGAAHLSEARRMWLRALATYPPALRARDYAALANTFIYPLKKKLR